MKLELDKEVKQSFEIIILVKIIKLLLNFSTEEILKFYLRWKFPSISLLHLGVVNGEIYDAILAYQILILTEWNVFSRNTFTKLWVANFTLLQR